MKLSLPPAIQHEYYVLLPGRDFLAGNRPFAVINQFIRGIRSYRIMSASFDAQGPSGQFPSAFLEENISLEDFFSTGPGPGPHTFFPECVKRIFLIHTFANQFEDFASSVSVINFQNYFSA